MLPALELTFTFAENDLPQAKAFLTFLRRAARKHSVKITNATNQAHKLTLLVPGGHRFRLALFLQELILTQGLYYYVCSVSNRKHVAKAIVKPIAEELLVSEFSVVYPVLLQKHLLQGTSDWAAGEFSESFSQHYEILFHRLKLQMLSSFEFIRDLDDLLTEFMLFKLDHKKGDHSPKFNVLVERCGKLNVLRDKRVRKLFNRVHDLRTRGLHRSERDIPETEITEISQSTYGVFEWLKDYWEAQREKTVVMTGRRYRRVRFGQELRHLKRSPVFRQQIDKEFEMSWREVINKPCHDCSVVEGELHLDGCDVEVCPRCAGQYLGCECHFARQKLGGAE